MKILQNKKVLIIIGVISITGLVFLLLYLRKQGAVDVDKSGETSIEDDGTKDPQEELLLDNPTQENLYEEEKIGEISIKLPHIWSNDLQDYSQDNHEYFYIKSSPSNDSFVFETTYEYVTDEELVNYQSENMDSQALYSPIDDYVEDDFEVIATINGQTLLVSKLGGIKYQNSVIIGTELTLDYPNYVYQKYEREDGSFGISFAITAFDERVNEPRVYQSTVVTYMFHSQGEIEDWDAYKRILTEVISSM